MSLAFLILTKLEKENSGVSGNAAAGTTLRIDNLDFISGNRDASFFSETRSWGASRGSPLLGSRRPRQQVQAEGGPEGPSGAATAAVAHGEETV